MRIVCWQTIFIKYHSLFNSKVRKDVTKFVLCCSRDWLVNISNANHNKSQLLYHLLNYFRSTTKLVCFGRLLYCFTSLTNRVDPDQTASVRPVWSRTLYLHQSLMLSNIPVGSRQIKQTTFSNALFTGILMFNREMDQYLGKCGLSDPVPCLISVQFSAYMTV